MKCAYKNCTAKVNKKFCSERCKRNHYVVENRRKIKRMAIEYKGGKCSNCGYNKCPRALSFHHLDPAQKDFQIGSKGQSRSWEKTKKELDKCVLLCANCHAEEHEKLNAE